MQIKEKSPDRKHNEDLWRRALAVLFAIAFVVAIVELVISPHDRTALVTAIVVLTGALIITAILPKITEFSIGPGGIQGKLETKVNQLQDAVTQQGEQIANQQEIINNLAKYSMSASIFRHLCGISCLYEYNYNDDEAMRREMYFLRDNGFIMPKGSGGWLDFNSALSGKNLVKIAEPTPIGKAIVKLRHEEVRGLIDLNNNNLRVDPADL